MTREEQIIEAGAYHSCGCRPPKTCGHNMHELAYINRNLAFEAGAKWADEHPDNNHTYTKQQLIDMGFAFTTNGDIVTPEQSNEHLKNYLKYQKQKFIEQAKEWLKNTIDDDVLVKCGSVIKCMGVDDFVLYFREIMEE